MTHIINITDLARSETAYEFEGHHYGDTSVSFILEVFAPGDEGLAEAIKNAGFAASAFGVETPWEDRIARYGAATEVKAEEFGAHLGDVVLGANPEH